MLAFKREGYRWSDVSLKDLKEILTYPGFYRLAVKYVKFGSMEMVRIKYGGTYGDRGYWSQYNLKMFRRACSPSMKLGPVASPVIQAYGKLSFEDDLRSGGLLYCVSQ